MVFSYLGEDFEPEIVTDLSRRRGTVRAAVQTWLGGALGQVQKRHDDWRDQLGRGRCGAAVVAPCARPGYPVPPVDVARPPANRVRPGGAWRVRTREQRARPRSSATKRNANGGAQGERCGQMVRRPKTSLESSDS